MPSPSVRARVSSVLECQSLCWPCGRVVPRRMRHFTYRMATISSLAALRSVTSLPSDGFAACSTMHERSADDVNDAIRCVAGERAKDRKKPILLITSDLTEFTSLRGAPSSPPQPVLYRSVDRMCVVFQHERNQIEKSGPHPTSTQRSFSACAPQRAVPTLTLKPRAHHVSPSQPSPSLSTYAAPWLPLCWEASSLTSTAYLVTDKTSTRLNTARAASPLCYSSIRRGDPYVIGGGALPTTPKRVAHSLRPLSL